MVMIKDFKSKLYASLVLGFLTSSFIFGVCVILSIHTFDFYTFIIKMDLSAFICSFIIHSIIYFVYIEALNRQKKRGTEW